MDYEKQVELELTRWKASLLQRPGVFERTSKTFSNKINNLIPQKVHDVITASVKAIFKTSLLGAEYTPKGAVLRDLSLKERDEKAKELLTLYRKIAAAEGAGAGAGGILLGLADFPALIAIHMKFLFELAHIYGYSTASYRERLYLLYVFQLAFSGYDYRRKIYNVIKDWENTATFAVREEDLDWEKLQIEYRDTIDFRKMLQLVPGIGAAVGAWANYGLQDELGVVGMNCYRIRILKEQEESEQKNSDPTNTT